MRTAAVAFLLSMLLAAALTPLVRQLALSRGWLDLAVGSRKLHGRPVPRLGGLAIVLAFFAPILLLRVVQSSMSERLWSEPLRIWSLLGGGVVIATLGLVDDLRGLGALQKLTVQFGVAGLLWAAGVRIETLATPFGGVLSTGVFALPLTLFWIVGVINAMNLIDGLDGLAGGVALFALGATFVVAAVRADAMMALLSAALAGGVLGFLVYNWNPASIFMGDTGAMFLGYVLGVGSILTRQKSSTAVALLVPIVALGLPIADTLLAISRRALLGRSIFSADRDHIHHRLLALGLSPRQAVLVLWSMSALLCLSALILSFANSALVAATLLVLAIVGFFAMRQLGYLSVRASAPGDGQRQRNLALRRTVRAAGEKLRAARSHAELATILTQLAPVLRATCLKLVDLQEAAPEDLATDTGPHVLRVRLVLPGEPSRGALFIEWGDGRHAIDRDDEIAAELLCESLAVALDRLALANPGPTEH